VADYEKAFKHVLKVEGGYVDDPSDSGGKTRYGITEKVARKEGYAGDMRELPIEFAKEVYKKNYWNVFNADDIDSQLIAEELFDTGVNCGIALPKKWLQENLNVLNNGGKHWNDLLVDGKVGKKTTTALNKCTKMRKGESRLYKLLNADQTIRYKEITKRNPKNERFMGGWLDNRVVYGSVWSACIGIIKGNK
jgi:lysozyme family protein